MEIVENNILTRLFRRVKMATQKSINGRLHMPETEQDLLTQIRLNNVVNRLTNNRKLKDPKGQTAKILSGLDKINTFISKAK